MSIHQLVVISNKLYSDNNSNWLIASVIMGIGDERSFCHEDEPLAIKKHLSGSGYECQAQVARSGSRKKSA
jgi:hypothetical protein